MEEVEARLPDLSTLLTPVESIELGMPRWRSGDKLWVDRLMAGEQLVIEPPSFLSGIEGSLEHERSSSVLTGWAKPFVLLREDGRAFGMGAVRQQQETGRVLINMKRGL